jgi:uncharacterized protein
MALSAGSTNKFKSWFGSVMQSAGFNPADNFFYLTLLSAPVLLTVYRYFAEAQNFNTYFPTLGTSGQGEIYSYLLEYLAFFFLVFMVPFGLLKAFDKTHLVTSLFSFKNFRKHIVGTVLTIVFLVIPSAYNSSFMPEVLAEYPLPRFLLQDQQLLPVYMLALFFLYYVGWEFFFRGFLLFGLKEKYGAFPAILIQTISSCLVHIDKPAAEIVGSIPFGILFGIIALRTKSIWVVVFIHAALGIFNDLFIIF